MKILWTGDRGFIAGYAIQKLLNEGHEVFGVDNDWKYGPVKKSYDDFQLYHHYKFDCKDKDKLKELVMDNNIDVLVLGAAIIGGISLFHELAYDLMSENEKLTATGFDIAVDAYKDNKLKQVLAISSSMVFESANTFPSKEGDQFICPPPLSTYGFQKLAVEYFAKGARQQYDLPVTIVRPFNCVGVGEQKALIDKKILSGNVNLAMSHVVSDLIQKIFKGQNPLHILGNGNQIRHYTYGGDLANGIYKAITVPRALNDDFNLSTDKGHSVLELAKIIWDKIKPGEEFKYISDAPFLYDVQKRVPNTEKAKAILNFDAGTSLETALDEIIPWVKKAVEDDVI